MTIDELLKKYNLKFEDLNVVERETLFTWIAALEKGKLTIESIKTYISAMRDAVEHEITEPNLDPQKDLLLKARLRNYMLLDAFLSTPGRAKQALERAVAGIASPKK